MSSTTQFIQAVVQKAAPKDINKMGSLSRLAYFYTPVPNIQEVAGVPTDEETQKLLSNRGTLEQAILKQRLAKGAKLEAEEVASIMQQTNYADCIHSASLVKRIIEENKQELKPFLPQGIIILLSNKAYYTVQANIFLAPFISARVKNNMDETAYQRFKQDLPMLASPHHMLNVLNMPKDLSKKLERNGKVFLSNDFKELGPQSVIIDEWINKEPIFESSKADEIYKPFFSLKPPPYVLLLKSDHPIAKTYLF